MVSAGMAITLFWKTGNRIFGYFMCNCLFGIQGPYLISARTHLQQALGDENVLIVKFWDDAPTNARKIIENGLLVGLRRYRFFGTCLHNIHEDFKYSRTFSCSLNSS